MKHDAVVFIFIGLCSCVYLLTFAAVWGGTATLPLLAYLVVLAILLFMTYMFLHGAYYIMHASEKVEAKLVAVEEMQNEEFQAYLGRKCDVFLKREACIAKYGIDGKTQYEIVGISRMFGYIHGRSVAVYVIRHKVGVKVDYQVITQKAFISNFFLGTTFLIMTIAWLILFLCRGI